MALEEERRLLEEEKRTFEREKNAFFRQVEIEKRYIQQQKHLFETKFGILEEEMRKMAEEKAEMEQKKAYYEKLDKFYAEHQQAEEAPVLSGALFFRGVTNRMCLKKRYKDLIKIYHPDNVAGDHNTVLEINKEYQHLCEILT